jgi:predicted RNase H-like HicB family nuclease
MEQGGLGRSGKRWGWFVDVKDVKDILTAGKTIKVGKIDA